MREPLDASIASFLEHVRNTSPSEHTFVSYETDLRQFAEYLGELGLETADAVETATLRAYLRALFGWGFTKSTISRKLSSLRGFFAHLKKRGALQEDPTRTLRGPSAPKRLPRALSEEAVERLIQAAEKGENPDRDRAVMELLYGCALRISELADLRWENVDMEERWLLVLGKGDKERRVPFGACASRALEALRARGPVGPWVFSGQGGRGHLTVRTLHRIVTALAQMAGVEGVTPHVLRHSCATHLLERGASLKFVQEFLGHENLSTTQIYLTISASWMKENYARTHPRATLSD
ncbi:MAG: tyrosine-type recombinase/integrase [Fretibacterium sp.]|nr:tyrosine-type recombinase/integrase [Fretibacterium sp.]